jgi:predicted transcriptional regulator
LEGEQVQVDVSSVILTDIDDKKFTLSDLKGKALVFAGGGQPAAEQCEQWVAALMKECSTMNDVIFRPLAFVGRLPVFVDKGIIKGEMRKADPIPFIDWDGSPQRALGLVRRNVSYVFVIDKQGILRFRLAASLSDENLKTVIEQIKKVAV